MHCFWKNNIDYLKKITEHTGYDHFIYTRNVFVTDWHTWLRKFPIWAITGNDRHPQLAITITQAITYNGSFPTLLKWHPVSFYETLWCIGLCRWCLSYWGDKRYKLFTFWYMENNVEPIIWIFMDMGGKTNLRQSC